MHKDAQNELREALAALQGSRFAESQVLVEQGPVYLQFLRYHGGEVLFETVASRFLPPELKLSTGRAAKLREFGFEKKGSVNWQRAFSKSECNQWNVDELVGQCQEILTNIYASEGELNVHVNHIEEEHPENEELVDSMRAVASTRSGESRHRMYTELVNATLIIPIDPDAGDEADEGEDFLVTDTLDGHPVFLAFSDWESLRRWSPKGWSYMPMHGSEFFELALDRDLGSVQINPRGAVGGELYRHEVEMLVEGVRNYRKKMMN